MLLYQLKLMATEHTLLGSTCLKKHKQYEDPSGQENWREVRGRDIKNCMNGFYSLSASAFVRGFNEALKKMTLGTFEDLSLDEVIHTQLLNAQ